MKSKRFLSIIAIASVILMGACKKDKLEPSPTPDGTTPPVVIPLQTTVQATIALGAADNFAVLCGSGITNTEATTIKGRKVILAGGILATNIYWQIGSSATFGTTTVFKGNVIAMQSISFDTGATLDGRALTRTGAITMAGNTIVKQ